MSASAITSLCCKCGLPIGSSSLLIGGRIYHHECSPYASRERSDMVDVASLRQAKKREYYRKWREAQKNAGAITHERLTEILDYDPATGIFTWRPRSLRDDKTGAIKSWNKRYAGRTVGHKGKRGRLEITIGTQNFMAHRLAWFYVTGKWPVAQIDHRNVMPGDNRWTNLREATNAQNQANRGPQKDNKAGAKGVCWREKRQRWCAQIHVGGRQIFLGEFSQKADAADAYARAARIHFGEFARASLP